MNRCGACEREFNSNEALEMHNRSKHPKKIKRQLTPKQKKKIRNYSFAVIVLVLLVAFFSWRAIPPKDAPIIKINPTTINFGDISQALGAVNREVTITNTGKSNLVINNMDTSCACTSAAFVYQGKEGPRFSMATHGTNPKNFELVISPGESAQLKIYYDPNVHKELRGAVTRSVYIFSNDPGNSKEEVRINVNQVN